MKNNQDPRHIKRIKKFQALFAWKINPHHLKAKTVKKIIDQIGDIDSLIQKSAPKWPIDKINNIDLSILRLAIWELKNRPDVPPKVIIDEAIEIAKQFSSENSPAFINGALGTALKLLENPINEQN